MVLQIANNKDLICITSLNGPVVKSSVNGLIGTVLASQCSFQHTLGF